MFLLAEVIYYVSDYVRRIIVRDIINKKSTLSIIENRDQITGLELKKFKLFNKFTKAVGCRLIRSASFTGFGEDGYENIEFFSFNDIKWKLKKENIYLIVVDGKILKIGGTRTGMKSRCGSYSCGLPKNREKGTCSTTNYNVLTSIFNILKFGLDVNFWTYEVPELITECDPFETGSKITINAQIFHAYETRCMEIYKKQFGDYPYFSKNSDKEYK